MRVRGLKLHKVVKHKEQAWSHPMRVRGLKHFKKFNNSEKIEVAPHAGAWIETF